MNAHTPGPWTVIPDDDIAGVFLIEEIAKVERALAKRVDFAEDDALEALNGEQYSIATANCSLIAAAPELLEACRGLLATLG